MKSFFVFVLAGAVATDCSGVLEWVAGRYPGAGYIVKRDGTVYESQWYVTAQETPGVDAAWEKKEDCTSGSNGDFMVDCSALPEWSPTEIYATPTDVQIEGRVWRNVYYATGENDRPRVGGDWTPQGTCDNQTVHPATTTPPVVDVTTAPRTVVPATTAQRTVVDVTTAPPTVVPATTVSRTVVPATTTTVSSTSTVASGSGGVDCSSVYRWSASRTYSRAGELVHYKEKMYHQHYWTQNVRPDTLSGWILDGECVPGSAVLGVHPDEAKGDTYNQRLCSCCSGCATNNGAKPVCMDDVTDQWDCQGTWCHDYNVLDPATCQTVTDDGMLEWFTGELAEGRPFSQWPKRVFIPYIDVSLGKIPKLTDVHAATGVKYFVLAFVTATGNGCSGGFGGFTPVGQGATWWTDGGEMNIYTQVNEIRKLGGDAIVSLGGAAGTELASASGCDSVAKLKKAYEAVLDAVKMTVLDFDIEGPAAASSQRGAWARRFEAVKQIVSERPHVSVWYTLATFPRGLTEDGQLFIRDLMESGAPLDRLNLMTMDYGADEDVQCRGRNDQPDMHVCEQMAVDSVSKQLFDIAQSLGVTTRYGWTQWTDVYNVMGSTVMIGVNDVSSEVYTLDDAKRSIDVWTNQKPINLISQWSVARDSPCAQNSASPICSGGNVQSADYEFLKVFHQFTTQE